MNTVMQSIILGIIQGLTEFLPISSSAHLNIFPWLFGWETISDSFDIALHIGTFLALIVFYFKDWLKLLLDGCNLVVKKEKTDSGKFFWILFFSTIIAAPLSLIFDAISEKIINGNINTEMLLIAIALIVMGIILYIVDKRSESKIKYEEIDLKKGLLIGASQSLAAGFPGVSRSGITMTIARALKVDKEGAAKFSFMLGAPIVAGAVIKNIGDFVFSWELFLGILFSFISGILVMKFLINYLKKGSFKFFAIYRIVLGIIILGFIIF